MSKIKKEKNKRNEIIEIKNYQNFINKINNNYQQISMSKDYKLKEYEIPNSEINQYF